MTLSGENGFGLQSELRRVVASFVKEHSDLALERLDGEEVPYDRIRESLESMPFLVSKKLVVLRNPSAQKEFIEKCQALLESVGEETDVVIVEPKLDKRSVYYKYLKAHTDFHEHKELDANGLVSWLVAEAKKQGAGLATSDARYLVERVGAHQQLLGSELSKLLIYDDHVTRQTIDLLVEPTPQSTIFELIEAAFSGNPKRATLLYDEQRQLKVEPQQIIAMLAWQLHILTVVKAAGDRSDATVASEAKISPYVVSKTRSIARRLSLREIKNLVAAVLDIDLKSKTGRINPDEALRTLLVTGLASNLG